MIFKLHKIKTPGIEGTMEIAVEFDQNTKTSIGKKQVINVINHLKMESQLKRMVSLLSPGKQQNG